MRVMVFDTETTGLPLFSEPSEHPGQPHLVQYAATLFGPDRQEINSINLIIKPDGWEISPEVAAIHGISHERALAEGVPEANAVAAFLAMTACADVVCAYGIPFDTRILRIAMLRAGKTKDECDLFAATLNKHCVQKQATPIVKCPPTDKMMAAGRKTFKTPTLTEAIMAILGEELPGAHDAAVDVAATAKIYFAMNPLPSKKGDA